jgi:DNA-binding transcriptional LysR family regulator
MDKPGSHGSADTEALLSGRYWGELRLFLEVSRAQSFNNAAKRLNLTHPTVARKVRRLQDLMGVQLLVSTERGIKLTPRGEELARALTTFDQSLYAIASGLKENPRRAEATVRVSMIEALTASFAAPAIEAFSQRHPNIHLHMKGVTSPDNVRENQTDMMLAFAPDSRAGVLSKPLGSLHFQPTVSRSYVEKYGLPTARTIGRHKFLQSQFYEADGELWSDWLALVSRGRISHCCDNTFVYGAMVKLGLGIGLLGTYTMLERDAVPLDVGVVISVPLYGVALRERLRSRPVRIVFDWLCEIFSEKNHWFRREFKPDDIPPTTGALRFLPT